MNRLTGVKPGDPLIVLPRYSRRDADPEDHIVVKVGRKWVYSLRRVFYDSCIERGQDPAESRLLEQFTLTGSTRAFTPEQWKRSDELAEARRRFTAAFAPVNGTSPGAFIPQWGHTLPVDDAQVIELLDDLTATIEAHQRRWGATSG